MVRVTWPLGFRVTWPSNIAILGKKLFCVRPYTHLWSQIIVCFALSRTVSEIGNIFRKRNSSKFREFPKWPPKWNFSKLGPTCVLDAVPNFRPFRSISYGFRDRGYVHMTYEVMWPKIWKYYIYMYYTLYFFILVVIDCTCYNRWGWL